MAWINKVVKKKKDNSDRKKQRMKMYNDAYYRQVRDNYMRNHPLCEDCMNMQIENEDGSKKEKITPSIDLHHLQSPFAYGLNENERYARLIDESNFIALCKFHHMMRHAPKGCKNEWRKFF
jgi:hypothetical protein